jgi:hypothetical protein
MGQVPGDTIHGRHGARPQVHRAPDARPGPWQQRPRSPAATGLPADLLGQSVGTEAVPAVERRLPRRAEVLWNQLRGDAALPPAEAAAALLGPPFSTQAILVSKPLRGRPQIGYAGTDVGWPGSATIGPATADSKPTAPIPYRLVALALAAIAAGQPLYLDSDFDPDTPGPRAGILFRAVALPLATDPASGLEGLAVSVLSWRKLLSADETSALHSELQAAMNWLGSTGRGGALR